MLSRLTINATQTCNLGCKYCYAGGGDYGGPAIRLQPSVATKRLRDAAEHHGIIKLVQFIGGEPLLNLPAMQAVAEDVEILVADGILQKKTTAQRDNQPYRSLRPASGAFPSVQISVGCKLRWPP